MWNEQILQPKFSPDNWSGVWINFTRPTLHFTRNFRWSGDFRNLWYIGSQHKMSGWMIMTVWHKVTIVAGMFLIVWQYFIMVSVSSGSLTVNPDGSVQILAEEATDVANLSSEVRISTASLDLCLLLSLFFMPTCRMEDFMTSGVFLSLCMTEIMHVSVLTKTR